MGQVRDETPRTRNPKQRPGEGPRNRKQDAATSDGTGDELFPGSAAALATSAASAASAREILRGSFLPLGAELSVGNQFSNRQDQVATGDIQRFCDLLYTLSRITTHVVENTLPRTFEFFGRALRTFATAASERAREPGNSSARGGRGAFAAERRRDRFERGLANELIQIIYERFDLFANLVVHIAHGLCIFTDTHRLSRTLGRFFDCDRLREMHIRK